ncbi:hypothetical protein ANOM_004895 [Aspergillus nomiae NRRL 13137]|uniref:Azaphilone pigments biosynthesis cluster protein L N-terminal domain-containing protein n=1 Tax=Aspergillus nomiae NRRL (strain ATCC 15546 / NRRL 13137 / CBS 260.88 / M93) TaxID=1509407 RepID=A0A0L1J424_ASPN3|nr:uncharacterized protein ANOM_004895 [Aspergillus nomiae NRRL 13137]KNG86556.1 hypothetical protein ANOM_004895 [Aspergillus nomiae NRRL 13137]
MAETIGLASGLLALATFAFQSSLTLHETVNSFRSHTKRVRDLIEELEALSGVLAPLRELLDTPSDVDLSALDLPLLRCGNACNEFEQELIKCSSRSTNRTSFRDWAKLRYMGDDIDGFRRMLAGYKLTINIALTDANLRKSSVNTEAIESYKVLIETAKLDLESHLESIDGKLEVIFGQTVTAFDSDALELRRIKEERLSTEKCLQICAQLSEHIDQIQLSTKRSDSSPGPDDPDAFPERVTNEGLEECKNKLAVTIARLEKHMQDLIDRLLVKSKAAMTSENEVTELKRLREEWETARQCMDICSKADNHLKENISSIHNYGAGDALQFMVSTTGKTIHGTNRGVGWRTRQVGGHLSDASVQQLSRDLTNINFRVIDADGQPMREYTNAIRDRDADTGSRAEFKERYGRGFTLTPKSETLQMSPTGSQ